MTIHLELPIWAAVLMIVLLAVDVALDVRTWYWEGRRAKAEIERMGDKFVDDLRKLQK